MNLKTYNVEAGFPSLDEARRLVIEEIRKSKREGVRVLKIIHGYGSSGKGGTLNHGLRKSFALRKKEGVIKEFIPGRANFTISSDRAGTAGSGAGATDGFVSGLDERGRYPRSGQNRSSFQRTSLYPANGAIRIGCPRFSPRGEETFKHSTSCSSDGHHRNFLVQVIPAFSHRPGVEHGFVIHQKTILMMTVGEHDLDEPPAIVAPLHGKRVPMVEITGHLNGVRLGRPTVKIDRPERRRAEYSSLCNFPSTAFLTCGPTDASLAGASSFMNRASFDGSRKPVLPIPTFKTLFCSIRQDGFQVLTLFIPRAILPLQRADGDEFALAGRLSPGEFERWYSS